MNATSVGFIGTGVMGAPMARNLQKAGFSLHIYARRPERVKEMTDAGAILHSSAAELAKNVDVTVTCLPADAEIEEVVLDPEGWLSGAPSHSVLVDTTTATPKTIVRVDEICKSKGIEVLDAPISGGVRGAREASLTFMVGGEASVLERCRPVFEAMGKTIFHVGPVGAGKSMKLLNQVMLAANTWAACEAAVLAKKAGVDLEMMQNVVSKSSGQSFTFDFRMPQFIMKGDFSPGFKTSLQIKDLNLALQMGDELEVPMLVSGMVYQAFRACAGAGNAELDISAAAYWLGLSAGVSFD